MRPLVLALGVLTLAGCTTSLQEIRDRPPARTGDFPQSYQALARCIYDRLDAQMDQGFPSAPSAAPFLPSLSDLRYSLDDRPALQARVSAMTGGLPSSAVFEIAVQPTATGGAHVEYRRRWWGSPGIDGDAWAIVAACGETS